MGLQGLAWYMRTYMTLIFAFAAADPEHALFVGLYLPLCPYRPRNRLCTFFRRFRRLLFLHFVQLYPYIVTVGAVISLERGDAPSLFSFLVGCVLRVTLSYSRIVDSCAREWPHAS